MKSWFKVECTSFCILKLLVLTKVITSCYLDFYTKCKHGEFVVIHCKIFSFHRKVHKTDRWAMSKKYFSRYLHQKPSSFLSEIKISYVSIIFTSSFVRRYRTNNNHQSNVFNIIIIIFETKLKPNKINSI